VPAERCGASNNSSAIPTLVFLIAPAAARPCRRKIEMSPGVQSRDDTPDGGEDGRGREIIFIPWACRRGDLLLVACSRTHLSCKRDQARLSIAPRRPTPTFTSSWNVAPTERSRWSATMQRPASDNREAQSSTSRSRAGSTPFAPDSSLEGGGFELPARERCKRGLRRKSPASAACRRRSSAAAVGSHQLRRQAKSRNRTLIVHGTGSSNFS